MLLFVSGIDLAFVILGGIVGIIVLALFLYKAVIADYYRRARRKKIDSPLKASELARANLDRAGLTDIEVKVKFFASGYKHNKKVIYISKAMERKATIYSISRVMQFVSLAILYHTDDNVRKKLRGTSFLTWTSTIIFFVMIIVSAVLEFIGATQYLILALILTIVALGFYIFCVIYSIRKGNILKKANDDAIKYIKTMRIFDDNDIKKINKLYVYSAREYDINLWLSIIYVVYYAFKVIGFIFKIFGKK